MKKTLVSLFALLAMGSTAFAANQTSVDKSATITTEVIKVLEITPPSALSGNDLKVVEGLVKDLELEFNFTVKGQEDEVISYALATEVTTGTPADAPELTIENQQGPTATTATINATSGQVDLNYKVIKIDASAQTVKVGDYVYTATLTVEYTNY